MSKGIALAAFNAAVLATNAGHMAKRGAVAAAKAIASGTVTAASGSKDAGVAFWAGMKYAHNANKVSGATASTLSRADIDDVEDAVIVEDKKPRRRPANKKSAA